MSFKPPREGFSPTFVDVTITGNLEVDGNFSFGSASVQSLFIGDDDTIKFGNTSAAPDVSLGWNTTQTVDALFLGLATAQNTFIIAENGDIAYDFAHGAQTNPTLFIQSATQSATEFAKLNAGDLSFGLGIAVIATDYSIGRDADATNQLHFNVPTGASYEWSINDVARMTMDVTGMVRTQGVSTTGVPTMLTMTSAAHTGGTAATEWITENLNFSATKTWAAGAGPLATQREFLIQAPTYAGNAGGALTITSAATFAISGAPIQGANMTLSNTYALWVQGGVSKLSGTVRIGSLSTQNIDTGNMLSIRGETGVSNGNAYLATTSADGNVIFYGGVSQLLSEGFMGMNTNHPFVFRTNNADRLTISAAGTFALAASASASGTPTMFSVTVPANTGLTTTVEVPQFNFINSATQTWATGTVALQRFIRFQQPTIAAAGSSVFTQAINLSVSGAPNAGANVSITQPTGLFIGGSSSQRTVAASAASWVFRNVQVEPITVTLQTDVTNITSTVGAVNMYVGSGTLTNDTGAQVFSNAASLYIAGAWTVGANMTITNNYAIFSDAGTNRFDGSTIFGTTISPQANDGAALGTTGLMFSDLFLALGGVINWNNGDVTATHAAGGLTVTSAVQTTGSPALLTITGAAHTTLTKNTEATDINFNLARTVQFATVDTSFLNQRAVRFQAPTYGFVGSSTIMNAINVAIGGGPVAGTNAIFTNAYGLFVEGWSANGASSASVGIEPSGIATGFGAMTTLSGLFYGKGIPVGLGDQTANLTNLYGINLGIVTYTSTTNTRTVTGNVATLYVAGAPVASTNVSFSNATYSLLIDDGLSRFDGNVILGAANVGATAANGVLGLSNGATAPSTSVDLVQLYGVDNSAGHATLGLFTEEVAAVDASLISSHSLTIQINGSKYKLMLVVV